MDTLPTLSTEDLIVRLLAAALLGATIGFEREWRERAAGLRTHMLVCIGAAVFTVISAYPWNDWYSPEHLRVVPFDPTRISAQVVSGIGFLGAGAILRSGLTVQGLTTAASLWAVAAIGMSAGAGSFDVAVAATVIVLFALVVLRRLPDSLYNRFHKDRVTVQLRISQQ